MTGHVVTRDEAPKSADLVVVGGGIVGAATAFFASRAGLDTVVLERRGGLATLTTTRSLEAFRAQFEDPEDIAMMQESIGIFERFAEVVEIPGYEISLHQQGYLFVSQAEDGEARVRSRVERQRAAGLADVELLSGDEARDRFPYLASDVRAGAFRGRDGWLASHEATYGFALGCSALFCLETEVLGFEMTGGRLAGVRTSRGTIASPRAVIAAGPFSGRVCGLAGFSIPFGAVRRHRGGIRSHSAIPRHAPMTVSLETGAHWRPEGPGAYLGWSAALEERPEEPRSEVLPDWTFPALVLEAVSRFSPFWVSIAETLTHANVTVEAGQYDMTPDAKPLIGAAGAVEGLYLNTGYSGHGVMGAPAGGRMVVDALVGRLAEDQNPFSLSRFSRPGGVAGKRPL
jgi:sarcosine oxidase subunit beta